MVNGEDDDDDDGGREWVAILRFWTLDGIFVGYVCIPILAQLS